VTDAAEAGFVGLGRMGRPMATNLARAGFALTVRDADPERQQRFAAEHGCAQGDAPDAFRALQVIVTMVPTGADVREVLLDWEGGLAAALPPGAVLVDMSSSDPTGTRELGATLSGYGVALVDAPVSGGVPKAETGTLAIMVGGDDEGAVDRVRPLLEAMGDRLFRTGPLGSGHAMKALNNCVAAAGYTAAAEALLIGARFGLDPADMIEVLNASTGRNFNTEMSLKEHALPRRFATGFALPLMTKDVGIAAKLADDVEIDAPVSRLLGELWRDALAGEGDAADFTAALRHWEKLNGLELPVRPSPQG
jgi:3-hydroxyisobutyrate dehydrogenase